MPTGSLSASSFRKWTTTGETVGGDGSTLLSSHPKILSPGKKQFRFLITLIQWGLDLWSFSGPALTKSRTPQVQRLNCRSASRADKGISRGGEGRRAFKVGSRTA